jgi:hypothetical protein
MTKYFYGRKIIPITFKDGTIAKLGDVIRWNCFGSDDNKTWTFTGIYHSDHIVYMGGGIDFGIAIGKKIEIKEAITKAENNDADEAGIIKIGEANEINNLISKFNE